MAHLDTGAGAPMGRHAKLRAKRTSTRIDMTPMVDLAFLLLTFFVLTSTFTKPAAMEIVMPVNGPPSPVKNVLTLILDKSDTIHYYYGMPDTNAAAPFSTTDYSSKGVRQVLIRYNRAEFDKVNELERKLMADRSLDPEARKAALEKGIREITSGTGTLTVVVRTCDNAPYARVIDIMDELHIAYISRKAILDISPEEKLMLAMQKGAVP
jgi:biopolymer transport protein ExbD